MNIALTNFTEDEREALARATAKLRASQKPDKKPSNHVKPTIKNIAYSDKRKRYSVYVRIDGQKIYCGSMRKWNEKEAMRMQHDAEKRYFHNTKASRDGSSQD